MQNVTLPPPGSTIANRDVRAARVWQLVGRLPICLLVRLPSLERNVLLALVLAGFQT